MKEAMLPDEDHAGPMPEGAIAIVGMAGRFPGARDTAEFWTNLRAGRESIRFFDREELLRNGVAPELVHHPLYVNASGRLDDVERFDADFFAISPREAEIMDPQHRIFLECASAALENAGHDPDRFAGAVGVFAGTGLSTYLLNHLIRCPEIVDSVGQLSLSLGNNKDYLPLRVSYKLNLKGPSINVNTACSSSLVAVHLACQSLLDFQCDMALAGGIGIQVPQDQGYLYSPNGIGSPDGHCRAFDRSAQGTVSGNGGGVVVLKRLSDALEQGDTIHALILASAINNDGAAKVGFTAPSVEGQSNVIMEALAAAQIDVTSIGYVEAHGTGTPLGDPIEIAALTRAFAAFTPELGFCAVGSVKTNIGHLDEGAGIAGLIKTVLSLRHRELPPSLHFRDPNPEIRFSESPFYVQTRLTPWERRGTPRRAGVSSFGLGGTNAHVVLQEAPPPGAGGPSRPWHLLTLSARTPAALEEATLRLAAHIEATPDIHLADLAYTLQVGRRSFACRKAVPCRTVAEAVRGLRSAPAVRLASDTPREVVFLFPGQGTQYVGMGQGLYQTEAVFRQHVDRCCELLRPHLGLDLRHVLFAEPGASGAGSSGEVSLQQTLLAQVALFTIQYALAQLWMSLEVQPSRMIGHSLGEYVAACLAGVFSLEDALALVATRGRLMQAMPPGGMVAVELSEEALNPFLQDGLELAAINAPNRCVVAGAHPRLALFQEQLERQGIGYQKLHTSHAFHSAALDPMLEPFLAQVRRVRLNPPAIPFVSNLTGHWMSAEQATDPVYWQQHLRRTVRFSDGIGTILKDSDVVLLEVGPGRTLGDLARRHPAWSPGPLAAQSLRHPLDSREDLQVLTEAVGQLWLAGACRSPARLYAQEKRLRIELPTYPFERKRYWIAPPTAPRPPRGEEPPSLERWFYRPVWKRRDIAPPALPASLGSEWLVFLDDSPPALRFLQHLRGLESTRRSLRIRTVRPGTGYALSGPDGYTLDPSNPSDYVSLLADMEKSGHPPHTIIHAWNLAPGIDDWEAAQARGLFSLVSLAQAVGRVCARGLRVEVLSDRLQRIADEEQNPLLATLLGAVRVIPREYPQIQCRSIDVDLAGDGETWVESLLAELQTDSEAPLVAVRGGTAWVQDFESLPLSAGSSLPQRLRAHGTYLLTGGLGSMGLAFARYLASEARARLVLLSRRGLPPEREWDPCCRDDFRVQPSPLSCLLLHDQAVALPALEARARASLAWRDIDAEPRLLERLNGLCSLLTLSYFARSGLSLRVGQRIRRESLVRTLRIVPKFDKFMDFLLRGLADDGLIRLDSDGIVVRELPPTDLPTARATLLQEYGEFHGLVRFLEHCVELYGPALSGEIPSISVLYPDGTPGLMNECGRTTPQYTGDQITLATLAGLVSELVRGAGGRTLRILEVGGGAGGLTRHLVPVLRDQAVEYHFTDLGGSIVRRAQLEAEAEGLEFMRFATLDVSRDPLSQGFALHGYDLIVGYNVIHASPDIEQAIGQLHTLLAPGGILGLVETTRLRRWDELVWGLTEGWWHFTDEGLRDTSPLIGLDDWAQVLQREGLDVLTFPLEPDARRRADTGLVLGQRAQLLGETALREAIQTVRACRAGGSDVMVLRADVADPAQVRAAFAQVDRRFGAVQGIIHAAGILGQGAIHGKTVAQMREALAAKVAGPLNLELMLRERQWEPDFLLLCSSLASCFPLVGQVDYCAANAFLDAYATARHRRIKTAVIAVDWGFWQALGMIEQASMPDGWKQQIADDIQARGLSGAGVEAFARILDSCMEPQVLVSPSPLESIGKGQVSLLARQTPVRPEHPWLDESLDLGDGISAFVARLSARRHWVLDEHRPLGSPVLPGTASLELALAAAQALQVGLPVELRDVCFLSPMVLGDDETREVRVLLSRRKDGYDFKIVSLIGDDLWQEHARGEVVRLEPGLEPPVAPRLDVLATECGWTDPRSLLSAGEPGQALEIFDGTGPLEGELCGQAGAAINLEGSPTHAFAQRVSGFPPHWRTFRRLATGARQALATLELAPELAAEAGPLRLHPSLLDMATGYPSLLDGFEAGAPFGYRRVRVWRHLTPRLHSFCLRRQAVSADERSYDLSLLDPRGRLLVEVEGFTLRTYKQPVSDGLSQQPENFCVEIDQPGNLSSLRICAAARPAPGPGEVEIQVSAAGLNFIEVLYSLGMLPEPPGVDRMRFGLEAAGTVSALGPGVEGLEVGDRVYGLVQRSFSRYALAPAYALARMPDFLTFAEAATIPAAYATAYFAMMTRGRMKPGEAVLIHSAAGGVGLAAVNIARWRGAKIHATAGSSEKRVYLEGVGVVSVSSSRSLEFVDKTLAATGGRGVDLVLNSLGGEFIPASLSLLAHHGRFLELGKRDIFQNSPLGLAPFEKHLSFMAIDVGPDLPGFDVLWKQVARAIQRRVLDPLPHRVFPLGELQQAFEFMAQARHIGKVVLTLEAVPPGPLTRSRLPAGRPLELLLKPWREAVSAGISSGGGGVGASGGAGVRSSPGTGAVRTETVHTATLSRQEHVRPDLSTPYRAATGADERTLLAIWEELLGVSGIGVDDNFFELRGDSLLAAQVTSRLYQAFQVKLPLSSVFEHPTVKLLSARIAHLRRAALDLEAAPTEQLAEGEVEHEL